VRRLAITAHGRRVQARMTPLAYALESEMLGPLSVDDRDRLRVVLSRLERHLAALGADAAEAEDAD
jgi:DNA-binding MarR family transcriptional regulator